MSTFAVHYTYRPGKAALRDEHRAAHREWLREEFEAHNLLMVGPYPDGTGALLLISADSLEGAETFLSNDPFIAHRAVDAIDVAQWVQLYGPFND